MRARRFTGKIRQWFDRKPDLSVDFQSVAQLELSAATELLTTSLQDVIDTNQAAELVEFPPHILAAANNLPETTADRLIDLRFTLASEPEVQFDQEVDWQYDPTPDPARRWAKALHRHYWLIYLANAYRDSKDERYANAAGELLLHWIAHNPPPPGKDEQNVAWTLMGAGIRAMIWPGALQLFSKSTAFRAQVAPRMLLSLHDHAAFLATYQTHLNHLLRESNGLLHIALRFPEFRAAPQWRQIASDRLAEEIGKQIQSDGSHIEQSLAYQWLVVEELESTRRLCERGAHYPELEELERKTIAGLDSLYEFLGGVVTPAGTWPQIKEGFYPSQESLRAELYKAAIRREKPGLQWIASNGSEGQLPKSTTRFFPMAGSTVFRDTWSSKANYLIFQNGAFGGPHGHEDALGFELWAGGLPFLVDPGTSSYNINDPYRAYFTSSNAHNTVVVDGMSQVRRWSRDQWWNRPEESATRFGHQGNDLSWVSGRYSGRYAHYNGLRGNYRRTTRGITHRRQVIFIRNSYWLLIDDLSAQKPSAFQQLFQCARGIDVTTTPRGAQLHNKESDQRLYITQAEHCRVTVTSGQTDPIAGWVCDGTRNTRHPAPQITFESNQCKQTRLLTLLMPAQSNQPEPTIQTTPIDPLRDSAKVTYHRNNQIHTDEVILGQYGDALELH